MVNVVILKSVSSFVGLNVVFSSGVSFQLFNDRFVRAELFDQRLVGQEIDVFREIKGSRRGASFVDLLLVFRFVWVYTF